MSGGSLQIGRWMRDLRQIAAAAARPRSAGRRRQARPQMVSASSKLSAISSTSSSAWPAASAPQTDAGGGGQIFAGHRQQHAGERWRRSPAPGRPSAACPADGYRGGATAAARPAGAASNALPPAQRGQSGVSSTGPVIGHFACAVQVEHAPVAGGAALEAGLPGLVERLHDEIVEPATARRRRRTAQEQRLVDPAGARRADRHAVGRPADFADDDRACRDRRPAPRPASPAAKRTASSTGRPSQ